MQKDVYSAFSQFLAGQLVAAYDKRNAHNPGLDAAVALLRAWNGQMDKDLAAPFLVTLAYQHVRTRHRRERRARQRRWPTSSRWRRRWSRNCCASGPPAGSRDYDDMLLRALADAVEEGRRMQGRDLKRWQYGDYLRLAINNPVIHQVPLVGQVFRYRPGAHERVQPPP